MSYVSAIMIYNKKNDMTYSKYLAIMSKVDSEFFKSIALELIDASIALGISKLVKEADSDSILKALELVAEENMGDLVIFDTPYEEEMKSLQQINKLATFDFSTNELIVYDDSFEKIEEFLEVPETWWFWEKECDEQTLN